LLGFSFSRLGFLEAREPGKVWVQRRAVGKIYLQAAPSDNAAFFRFSVQ